MVIQHETYFDLEKLKEHLRPLNAQERQECKRFEMLRNMANGMPKQRGNE